MFSRRMGVLAPILVAVVALIATGCGSADFAGSTAKGSYNAKPEPQPPQVSSVQPYSSLTWFWECETNPDQVPDGTDDDAVISGEGPHEFSPEMLDGTPVTISGELCPPKQLQRDIVFVIDVSGSMDDNDPLTGNSCGRLDAIEHVMTSIPAEQGANYSVVTFSDAIGAASTTLVSSADIYADLGSSAANASSIICAANGGTYYDIALQSAKTLLATGREQATKEIYFISDGDPNNGNTGVNDAATLKANGVTIAGEKSPVTIATVMLAGNDRYLEKHIASKDSYGNPLHAHVSQSSNLSDALGMLSGNEITGGKIKYRPLGSSDWSTVDLMDHLEGFIFTLPSITISKSEAPDGIELLYEYWDKHQNEYSSGGKLVWSEQTGFSENKD